MKSLPYWLPMFGHSMARRRHVQLQAYADGVEPVVWFAPPIQQRRLLPAILSLETRGVVAERSEGEGLGNVRSQAWAGEMIRHRV